MNRSEVQKCPFKDWQTILTLEEALSKIKNWFPLLFLDFKTSENPKCKQDIPSLLEQLATLIQAHHIESKVIIPLITKSLPSNSEQETTFFLR